MTDKLTDNEIIKALECCVYNDESRCVDCPSYDTEMDDCHGVPWKSILDLINRQNADIERLAKRCYELDVKREEIQSTVATVMLRNLELALEIAKAEAIKEFAERLKENNIISEHQKRHWLVVSVEDLDNLVKEMAGES